METLTKVIEKCLSQDWMLGNNDRGWKADVDYCLTASKFLKMLENYKSNVNNSPPKANGTSYMSRKIV